MKEVTLATAVILVIQEFQSDNAEFSAYDVTQTIRQKTNDGDFDLVDVNFVSSSVHPTPFYEVEHIKVRRYVEEFFAEGVFEADRKNNGKYNVYTLKDSDINTSPFTAPVPAAPTALSAPKSVASIMSSAPKASGGLTQQAKRKIIAYIYDHAPVSIKQIQSRLRHDGNYSCDEIRDWLISKGMVSPFDTSLYVSKQIVDKPSNRPS